MIDIFRLSRKHILNSPLFFRISSHLKYSCQDDPFVNPSQRLYFCAAIQSCISYGAIVL